MTGRITRRILLTILAASALGGCALLRSIIGGSLKKPTVQFERLQVTGANFDRVDFVIHTQVENRNSFGASVDGIQYELFVEEKSFLSGNTDKPTTIPAAGRGPVAFPVSVGFNGLVQTIEMLATKTEVPFRIQTAFRFDTELGSITIPFSHADTLPLPKLPAVSVRNARASMLSLSKLRVTIDLDVRNAGAFPVNIGAIGYGLKLANVSVGSGTLSGFSLAQQGTQNVQVPVDVDLVSLARAAGGAVARRSLPYALDLGVTLGQSKLPVGLQGQLRW